jgi:hypothetical protein
VVITPHVYPPSITGATFLGKDLWDQSRVAFGYLQGPGYCGAPMLATEGAAPLAVTMSRPVSRMRKLLQGFGLMTMAHSLTSSGAAADSTAGSTADIAADGKAPAAPTKPAGCTVFPVVIGETGSNFASATDRQWLSDFADYIMATVSQLSAGSVG